MNEMDLKPNSHKYKEEQKTVSERKPLDKVITGTVKTKKKSGLSKLGEVFIPEDIDNVGSYLLMDVVVPSIKRMAEDCLINLAHTLFGGGGSKRGSTASSYVSYRDYGRTSTSTRGSESRSRAGYYHDDVILETYDDAKDVLARMDELMETYGMVSVADLYDLVGKSCNYTDHNYGWTNIRNADAVRVREGWMLRMPKVGPLK